MLAPASFSTNIGYGSGNLKATVSSSTFSTVAGLPLIVRSAFGIGDSSVFPYRSSNQNMMSSAVNGCPSDHFMPLRSEERREGKSVDLGGRRIIKKKKQKRDDRA